MRKENNLGTDSMWRLVVRLAIPAMFAQFINVLYSIVDRIFIGNIPEIGATALAGVGICGPIVTLITSFSIWIGIGGSPLMSINMGENNYKEAERILLASDKSRKKRKKVIDNVASALILETFLKERMKK